MTKKRVRPRPEFAAEVKLAEQLRKFEYPDLDTKPPAPQIGGGGGVPTFLVAASDALDSTKAKADYVCDGVNDEEEIRAALIACTFGPGPGGRVLLSEGFFHIHSWNRIVLTQNQSLIGLGVDTTTINFETLTSIGGGEEAVIAISGPLGTLRDFSVFLPPSGNGSINQRAIRGTSAGGWRIENVAVIETNGRWNGIGLRLINSSHVRISNCEFNQCAVGLSIEGSSQRVLVNNIIASQCDVGTRVQVLTGSPSRVGFSNSQFHGNNTGLYFNDADFCRVADSAFEDNFDFDIHVLDSTAPKIADSAFGEFNAFFTIGTSIFFDGVIAGNCAGNTVWKSGEHGLRLLDSTDCRVTDNIFYQIGQTTDDTFDAIFLEGNSSFNDLLDNVVRPSSGAPQTRYGVNISASTCVGNVVGHNDLRPTADFGTGEINDNGTDTIFLDNIGTGGAGGGLARPNIATFSQSGVLGVGTGSFKLPFTLDAELVSVQLAVGTSPTGDDLIVDVNKNGTTVFTTQANRPTVPDGDADGVGAEAVPDVTAISEGEYLTIDIDQIGSSVAGEDLTVAIEWRPA